MRESHRTLLFVLSLCLSPVVYAMLEHPIGEIAAGAIAAAVLAVGILAVWKINPEPAALAKASARSGPAQPEPSPPSRDAAPLGGTEGPKFKAGV